MTCEFRLQEADVPPSYNLGLKDSSGVVDDKVFESLEISNAVCFCCSPVICTLCMKIQPLNAGMEGLLNKVFDGMFEPLCFCSLEVDLSYDDGTVLSTYAFICTTGLNTALLLQPWMP